MFKMSPDAFVTALKIARSLTDHSDHREWQAKISEICAVMQSENPKTSTKYLKDLAACYLAGIMLYT